MRNIRSRALSPIPSDIAGFGKVAPMADRSSLIRPQQNSEGYLRDIAGAMAILTQLETLGRGYSSQVVIVGITPTLIYHSSQPRGIMLLNPARSAGLTQPLTILPLAARGPGAGNTTATPTGVGNYRTLSLFLNVTVNAGGLGTLVIDALTKDPLSGLWAISQANVFAGLSAVGTYYVQLGTLGIDSNFALAWTVGVQAITFSISGVEKDGLPGSSSGLDQTVYIGANSGINTSSGFPILEGTKEKFFIREETNVFGIAATPVSLKLFNLT
jgi:hypothetical protein